jgi:hypothetical protein
MDRWMAQERAWLVLEAALRLFTPEGTLNTRTRAEAAVQAALAQLTGREWARVHRRLVLPRVFTFLDRVHEQLQALPAASELRQAAVDAEGARRQPQLLRGEHSKARALRGVLLLTGVVLSLAAEAGALAQKLVRAVLEATWRSSSGVEGINSVLRMQQQRQKRLTQELLDLKRVYWNLHIFRSGRRKGHNPYQRLGLALPPGTWWELLQKPPEQLRQELSALNPPL